MDPEAPERLHKLIMDLVRVIVLTQLEQAQGEQPLSLSQAYALHELDVPVALSQRDLAERLHLEKSSVSRMAAEMERAGLLVRERDPENRRFYRLRLTERGRALHRRIAANFHEQYLAWASAMTPAELDALLTGLTALLREIRDQPTTVVSRPGR